MVKEPAAIAMVIGYMRSALGRKPRCREPDVLDYFRKQQRMRHLPTRFRQAVMSVDGDAPRTDLLLVADIGGHLLELVLLAEHFSPYTRAWVTQDKDDSRSLLRGEVIHFAHGPTCRSPKNLVRNILVAWRVIGQTRPRAVITTGAGASVPFAWIARLRSDSVVIFIEIFGSSRPSLSCRLVQPVADRIYVQWPELHAQLRGSIYVSPGVHQ
jgi:beta-1,4-N-acetylglucosaminyltransferase